MEAGVMKAYLFSKGETTTELSIWSLERLGFQVELLYDPKTSLHQKYMKFLILAEVFGHDAVLRTDADIIHTRGLLDLVKFQKQYPDLWFLSGRLFCFLRMDEIVSTPNILTKEAIEVGLKRMPEYREKSRPETELTRCPEFYAPRRYQNFNVFTGIHGFKQSQEDIDRVIKQKVERGQYKDWDIELIQRMKEL